MAGDGLLISFAIVAVAKDGSSVNAPQARLADYRPQKASQERASFGIAT
jgi:hypothetical protein